MRFSVIASGSRANCTYFEAGNTRILIDCGLSAKQTEQRLVALGIDPGTISGIFITHEHSDHLSGVSVFSRRHKVPVFANGATAEFVKNVLALEIFETGQKLPFQDLELRSFSVVHDAVEPVGYTIEWQGLRFVQVTDLGKVTPLVEDAINGAHALVLESNYDYEMLQTCEYPWELKQRIASSHGHLPNNEAGRCVRQVQNGELGVVVLAHLSENSNTPDHALAAVRSASHPNWKGELTCGSPYASTPLFNVDQQLAELLAV